MGMNGEPKGAMERKEECATNGFHLFVGLPGKKTCKLKRRIYSKSDSDFRKESN